MISEITYNLKARITLYPTELGGRKKPIYNGYKPSFVFSTKQHYTGQVKLIGVEELKPGDSARVKIDLLPARTIRRNLKANDSFTITDGNKTVGSGTIESVMVT